ncbi:MAG: ATP-binding protein [Patescibacteria group bacterium]
MKIVYIMRGVSGSGKSTVAKILAGENGVIHSTDDYLSANGKYVHDPALVPGLHKKNYEAFCRSLRQEIPVVVCDNTNGKRWEFQRYIEAAKKEGYWVAVVTMSHPDPEIAAARNVHGVTAEIIRRKIEKWEE